MLGTRRCAVRSVTVVTSDGVRLYGRYQAGAEPLVVLCPGFTQSAAHRTIRRVAAALAGRGAVLALDPRGHGQSRGLCTLGDEEVLDVDAALSLGRELGHQRVATLGLSMGAAVVLRHAAGAAPARQPGALTQRPDAVAAVSSPSRWWIRETSAMRRVHWVIEQPHGRLVGRALGVRLAGHWSQGGWPVLPASPVEVVERIAPIPLLLVHGTADRYLGVEHAEALHRATRGHGQLWLEPGMGHGASGTGAGLVDRIVTWASKDGDAA